MNDIATLLPVPIIVALIELIKALVKRAGNEVTSNDARLFCVLLGIAFGILFHLSTPIAEVVKNILVYSLSAGGFYSVAIKPIKNAYSKK